MECQINGLMGQYYLSIMLMDLVFINILSSSLTILLGFGVTKNLAFLMIPLLGLDTVLVMSVYAYVGGKITETSVSVRQRMIGRLVHGKDVKIIRLQIETMHPVRMKFGTNFVEMQTLLNLLNFCMANTISVLLLRGH